MRTFTIEEARAMLPELRKLLAEANSDLSELAEDVAGAHKAYAVAERLLDEAGSLKNEEGLDSLRCRRTGFQEAIQTLSEAQARYLRRLNFWVERILTTGVVLRDLREGLLDFPVREGNFEYLLCWRMDEPDISFWHTASDGFAGRKPLAVLEEFK